MRTGRRYSWLQAIGGRALPAALVLSTFMAVEAGAGQVGQIGKLPSGPAALPKSGLPEGEVELAKGVFLVASRNLLDPNFYRTVILLLEYSPYGAMGVVINRPMQVPLSEVFPQLEGLRESKAVLYRGGPVAASRVMLLFRSLTGMAGDRRVFADVWMGAGHSALERLVADPPRSFRLFAGHAGWAPGQLDMEVGQGGWHVMQADSDLIFDRDPEDIWPKLMEGDTYLRAESPGPWETPGRRALTVAALR